MSKKADIKQDAKMMKGMTPAQKAKFKTYRQLIQKI